MSDVMDRIIADFVEGARRSEGLARGGRAGVELARENHGREEKLAGIPSNLVQLATKSPIGGALAGAGVGGLASLLSGDDHPLRDMAIGAGVGGLHANLNRGVHNATEAASHGRAALHHLSRDLDSVGDNVSALKNMTAPATAHALQELGASGSTDYVLDNMMGAGAKAMKQHASNIPLGQWHNFNSADPLSMKQGALSVRYDDGAKAAAARLGIKEAFLPLVGSLLGGTALRAGVGALARRAGGGMIGNIAGKVAPRMAGGIGGAATDMVGSMAGGAIGTRLQGQQGG